MPTLNCNIIRLPELMRNKIIKGAILSCLKLPLEDYLIITRALVPVTVSKFIGPSHIHYWENHTVIPSKGSRIACMSCVKNVSTELDQLHQLEQQGKRRSPAWCTRKRLHPKVFSIQCIFGRNSLHIQGHSFDNSNQMLQKNRFPKSLL